MEYTPLRVHKTGYRKRGHTSRCAPLELFRCCQLLNELFLSLNCAVSVNNLDDVYSTLDRSVRRNT